MSRSDLSMNTGSSLGEFGLIIDGDGPPGRSWLAAAEVRRYGARARSGGMFGELIANLRDVIAPPRTTAPRGEMRYDRARRVVTLEAQEFAVPAVGRAIVVMIDETRRDAYRIRTREVASPAIMDDPREQELQFELAHARRRRWIEDMCSDPEVRTVLESLQLA